MIHGFNQNTDDTQSDTVRIDGGLVPRSRIRYAIRDVDGDGRDDTVVYDIGPDGTGTPENNILVVLDGYSGGIFYTRDPSTNELVLNAADTDVSDHQPPLVPNAVSGTAGHDLPFPIGRTNRPEIARHVTGFREEGNDKLAGSYRGYELRADRSRNIAGDEDIKDTVVSFGTVGEVGYWGTQYSAVLVDFDETLDNSHFRTPPPKIYYVNEVVPELDPATSGRQIVIATPGENEVFRLDPRAQRLENADVIRGFQKGDKLDLPANTRVHVDNRFDSVDDNGLPHYDPDYRNGIGTKKGTGARDTVIYIPGSNGGHFPTYLNAWVVLEGYTDPITTDDFLNPVVIVP